MIRLQMQESSTVMGQSIHDSIEGHHRYNHKEEEASRGMRWIKRGGGVELNGAKEV